MNAPSASRDFCRQTWSVRFIAFLVPRRHPERSEGSRASQMLRSSRSFAVFAAQDDACASFIRPRGQLHFLIEQRLFVQHRLVSFALVLPRRDVEEFVVIALG